MSTLFAVLQKFVQPTALTFKVFAEKSVDTGAGPGGKGAVPPSLAENQLTRVLRAICFVKRPTRPAVVILASVRVIIQSSGSARVAGHALAFNVVPRICARIK